MRRKMYSSVSPCSSWRGRLGDTSPLWVSGRSSEEMREREREGERERERERERCWLKERGKEGRIIGEGKT